ncbi:MAG: hypothetical protein KF760_15955 [Candidatus Eremiobacteraeota bacterium]|nr:hypothetical protein [Candidatus Eremiobacteraeota bacterium]MCW5867385.1 hypothetical protein [Candidatus Eremiobacteraeota bacterium]
MLAFALNPQPEGVAYQASSNRRNTPQRVKPATNLAVHERFVMKAEAIFPGSEIVSHQSQET